MNTRTSLILGAAIVIGCVIVTLFSNSPSAGQGATAVREGRYQVAVGQVPGFGGTPAGSNIVVTDTTNGQTWIVRGPDNWFSVGKAPR
jgi:hypothetical protein